MATFGRKADVGRATLWRVLVAAAEMDLGRLEASPSPRPRACKAGLLSRYSLLLTDVLHLLLQPCRAPGGRGRRMCADSGHGGSWRDLRLMKTLLLAWCFCSVAHARATQSAHRSTGLATGDDDELDVSGLPNGRGTDRYERNVRLSEAKEGAFPL
eukprot:g6385.t1